MFSLINIKLIDLWTACIISLDLFIILNTELFMIFISNYVSVSIFNKILIYKLFNVLVTV